MRIKGWQNSGNSHHGGLLHVLAQPSNIFTQVISVTFCDVKFDISAEQPKKVEEKEDN